MSAIAAVTMTCVVSRASAMVFSKIVVSAVTVIMEMKITMMMEIRGATMN